MKKRLEHLFKTLSHSNRIRIYTSILAVFMMLGVTLLVYLTGGIQFVYSHTMYIPIVMLAFMWGFKGGLVAGIFGGLLLGPFMLVDVDIGLTQTFVNWFYRLSIFVLLGGLIGYLFEYLMEQSNKASYYSTHHYNTGLPNYAYYLENLYDEKQLENNVSMTLQVNNYENLIILLGLDIYSTVMNNIYKKLQDILPNKAHIIQMDSRRFWIDIDHKTYKIIRSDFIEQLESNIVHGINIPLYIDFSVGVSMPSRDKTITQRFNESDIAALHAKLNHIKHVVFHEHHQEDQIFLSRLGALPLALKNKELFLLFQPIIDVKTGKTVVLEALIRWRKDGEILNPIDFIPLAEETRVIDQITEWVLDQVLDYYEYFKTFNSDIAIAMNISQRNLFNPTLIQKMSQKIVKRDIPHHKLEMEMTESTLMLNRHLTQSFLESFRSVGVKTTLDDFGTGYSSLSCLRDLPVDKVKIDREFIRLIEEKEDNRFIVKTIIDLAHYMKLEVVAEGIENQETYELIKDLGSDLVQGFYFSKPLSVKQVVKWLQSK